MWFNDAVIKPGRLISRMASSGSWPDRKVGGCEAPFDELYERRVLKVLNSFPDGARNRKGKKSQYVVAQSLCVADEPRSDCVVRGAEVQNYEYYESFLVRSQSFALRVGTSVENTCQVRFYVHPFPQLAMLLCQSDEICRAARSCVEGNCHG